MPVANNEKVLIAAPVHPVLTDGLKALGYNINLCERITQAAAYELVKGCTGIITSTRLQLDRGLLDAADKLKWIGRMGSGMEVIDMEYALGKGVQCFASPEGNRSAVGEHALGMLLGLLHRIGWSHTEMVNNIWRREENRGYELEGKTVGIIGCGHTGGSFMRRLKGFDVRILAYDKYDAGCIPPDAIKCDGLSSIYEEADIVSFHVPYQQDTIHYFNKKFIDSMNKPFILINTSRGAVVDTAALLAGMDSGKVTGACLDVFEQEPVSAMNSTVSAHFRKRLMQPNIVVTPHIAGYTFEALYKMSKVLLDKISAQTAV